MTFKAQQVLRTKVPLKTAEGVQVNPGTRVVVMKVLADGRARVKVQDPTFPALAKSRLEGSVGAFNATNRGRPTKAGK
jgi:membrane protein implicated in regulation of membrane protease activity